MNVKDHRTKQQICYGIAISSMILCAMSLSGCITDGQPSDGKLSILATLPPQKEMIDAIGNDHILLEILIPEGSSPHTYEPTPSQMITVADADMYLYLGSGIEFETKNLNILTEQNPEMLIIETGRDIQVVGFDEHYPYPAEPDSDPSKSTDGEHTTGGDPHVWTDPLNMVKMANVTLEAFIDIDPQNETDYRNNHAAYIEHLYTLDEEIRWLLGPYQNHTFLTYHPAWGYFGDRYELQQMAIEEGGKEPGPAGVAIVIEQARSYAITVIITEPQFDTSSAEQIASEIDALLYEANPLASDYSSELLDLAQALNEGMSLRYEQ